jgi:hypothetical protein
VSRKDVAPIMAHKLTPSRSLSSSLQLGESIVLVMGEIKLIMEQQNFVDFHKCTNAKGEDFQPCKQFKRAYMSLCPSESLLDIDCQGDSADHRVDEWVSLALPSNP